MFRGVFGGLLESLHDSEIDFYIGPVPGAQLVSITPYCITPIQLSELII